jgi:hypothetical protein
VFITYYLSSMHRLKVTPNFLIVDYGGISISTARGHSIPELTSPVDRVTMVFCSCFVDICRLSCTVPTLLAILFRLKWGKDDFGRYGACQTGSEVTVRFLDSDFGIDRLWNFSLIFYLSKVIQLSRVACKMPCESFGEGIIPREYIFYP